MSSSPVQASVSKHISVAQHTASDNSSGGEKSESSLLDLSPSLSTDCRHIIRKAMLEDDLFEAGEEEEDCCSKKPRISGFPSLLANSTSTDGSGCTSTDSTDSHLTRSLTTHSTSSFCLNELVMTPMFEDDTDEAVENELSAIASMALDGNTASDERVSSSDTMESLSETMSFFLDEDFPILQFKSSECCTTPSEAGIASLPDDTSTNPTANTTTVLTTTRKRMRFPKQVYMPVYKVLKADLRRQYAFMWNNCVNSGNAQLLKDFLFQYATEDIQYQSIAKPPNFDIPGLPVLPPLIQFASRRHFWMYYCGIMNTIPDFTATISNLQVRTRSGTEALQLEYDVTYEATLLTSLLKQSMSPKASSEQQPPDLVLVENGEFNLPFGTIGKVKTDKRRSKNNLALLQLLESKETIRFQLLGKAVLHVNADKLLTSTQVAIMAYNIDI